MADYKESHIKVVIVDYEMCNLFSVQHACEHIGLNAIISSNRNDIYNADGVILPGVGAFGNAMTNLRHLGLVEPIKEHIMSGKPFMGICLGMQLLLTESEEFGSYEGFNIINGVVRKFPLMNKNGSIKVPQIGWNRIYKPASASDDFWDGTMLYSIKNGEFMYFVHSFYAEPANKDVVLSTTDYEGIVFCSSIMWKNVALFQFHPEKSGREGIKIYKNWLEMISNYKESKGL